MSRRRSETIHAANEEEFLKKANKFNKMYNDDKDNDDEVLVKRDRRSQSFHVTRNRDGRDDFYDAASEFSMNYSLENNESSDSLPKQQSYETHKSYHSLVSYEFPKDNNSLKEEQEDLANESEEISPCHKNNPFTTFNLYKFDEEEKAVDEYDEQEQEDEIMKQIAVMNKIFKEETQDTEECISTLCRYFKENITNMANSYVSPKKSRDTKFIFSSEATAEVLNKNTSLKNILESKDNQKFLLVHSSLNQVNRALSQSCISSINIKELLSKIILNTEEEEIKQKESPKDFVQLSSCSTNNNSMGTLITQNIENQEEILKLILIGSKGVGKTRLIYNFTTKSQVKYEYIPSVGIDIKKKTVKVFDRNVRLEFFDTDNNLILKDITKVYYKIAHAILFVVDFQNEDSFPFIKNIIKEFLYYNNSTFAMIGINYDEKIHYVETNQFCDNYKIVFIPIGDYSNFTEDNYILENLLGLFLVKKIKTNTRKKKKKIEIKEKAKKVTNSFTNYKLEINEEDEVKENLNSSLFAPKIYRKYSGKC